MISTSPNEIGIVYFFFNSRLQVRTAFLAYNSQAARPDQAAHSNLNVEKCVRFLEFEEKIRID